MADYRHDCCGGFPGHSYGCRARLDYPKYVEEQRIAANMEAEKVKWRAQGFIYLGQSNKHGDRSQMLWGCRRGCGTVVWHIEDHIKNVCPKFEPVVGQADA